jgi:outer membrane protein TolC
MAVLFRIIAGGGLAACLLTAGCASADPPADSSLRPPEQQEINEPQATSTVPDSTSREPQVSPVVFQELREPEAADDLLPAQETLHVDNLAALVEQALIANPRLRQMRQEAAAAWDRVRYVDELPDPEVGAMAFVPPMHFADGRQVASISLSQRIPWLERLSAQEQKAYFEAWALDAAWQAERLRTISEVKTAYYRLYVVEQQLRINEENREVMQLLVDVATQRVVAQSATEGDVLLATLELSELEEQRFALEERRTSLTANLNRLLDRPSDVTVYVPSELEAPQPDWSLDELRQTAWNHQPDIAAAQLRWQAAEWGICVAELERRPEITLKLDWMVMAPRSDMGVTFDGNDTVQIGAMMSVPVWHEKYDAMRDEAIHESMAARFSVDDVHREYEEAITAALEQARAAARTAELYESTMLIQARQTFEADQRSYIGPGTVDFDRVMEDFRTVLTLEEGYHRAIGEWAIALALIEQALGRDLDAVPVPSESAPLPLDSEETLLDETIPIWATEPL